MLLLPSPYESRVMTKQTGLDQKIRQLGHFKRNANMSHSIYEQTWTLVYPVSQTVRIVFWTVMQFVRVNAISWAFAASSSYHWANRSRKRDRLSAYWNTCMVLKKILNVRGEILDFWKLIFIRDMIVLYHTSIIFYLALSVVFWNFDCLRKEATNDANIKSQSWNWKE